MATNAGHVTIDRAFLEKLLHHAAFAAHLVGQLDDDKQAALIRQLGDQVDEIAHDLSEILGKARTLAASNAATPDVAHNGVPMLAASAGGAGPVSCRDDLDLDDTLHAVRGGAS